ncbi:hypothetical protein ACFTZI_32445 [Streptomyces decoyicus]|uniref:hypothetical protein n=1 Tax=Streptomyces decoyicus TaxID=249567 RepID=UPI00362D3A03
MAGALGVVVIRPGPEPGQVMTPVALPGVTFSQTARVLRQLADELELYGIARGEET